jgi:hypothetical protein
LNFSNFTTFLTLDQLKKHQKKKRVNKNQHKNVCEIQKIT